MWAEKGGEKIIKKHDDDDAIIPPGTLNFGCK